MTEIWNRKLLLRHGFQSPSSVQGMATAPTSTCCLGEDGACVAPERLHSHIVCSVCFSAAEANASIFPHPPWVPTTEDELGLCEISGVTIVVLVPESSAAEPEGTLWLPSALCSDTSAAPLGGSAAPERDGQPISLSSHSSSHA